MNNPNYKVIFKGWNNDNDFELALTFKEINSRKKITIPPKILSELKTISEKKPNIILFQNIEDVLIIGNDSTTLNYVNYYVILFKSKKDGKKEAFLIGNKKKETDLEVLGIWPFNSKRNEITRFQILEIFDQITKKSDIYSDICLISS